MIDQTLLTILPPIIASILTYVIASKKSKLQYTETIANIQCRAIEVVTAAEQKMREEIRTELNSVREENNKLRNGLYDLQRKLDNSEELVSTLREEIISLKSMVDTYKEQLNSVKR